MPLVKGPDGTLTLVCLNGCHMSATKPVTKGFGELVTASRPLGPGGWDVRPPQEPPKEPPSRGTETTMRHVGGWHALTAVDPPRPMPSHMPGILPAPPGLKAPPVFHGGHGVPVRVYFCHVCGYVEPYIAEILDPTMWKV